MFRENAVSYGSRKPQHRLRHFEAQVVKCRDVEALQDLAIRLFAENQGRSQGLTL